MYSFINDFKLQMQNKYGYEPILWLYVDDVLIIGKDKLQAYQITKEWISYLGEKGFRLSKEKTQLFHDSISFLGRTISHKGIKSDDDKIKKLISTHPKNQKEAMKYCGLLNFLDDSVLIDPDDRAELADLTKTKAWGKSEKDRALQVAKKVADAAQEKNLITLTCPIPGEPLYIFTDASKGGMAGVLCQKYEGGIRVIDHYSKVHFQ